MKTTGIGTIKQRKNGLYEGQYYYEGKRKSIYSRNLTELRSKLNIINAEILQNNHIEPSCMTLAEWLNEWLETYASHKIRNSTLISYETYIRGHISNNKIAKMKLKDLKPRHFQVFFNEKSISGRLDNKKGGLSTKTLKNMYNMLHEALNRAVRDDLIRVSPLDVELGSADSREMRYLDRNEQKRLENSVINSLETIALGIIVSLYTGIRLGELLGLRWTNVNFKEKYIKITHTLARQDITKMQNKPLKQKYTIIKHNEGNNTAILLGPVKTNAGKRKIYLSEKALEALKRLKEYQQSINPLNSKEFNPYDFVLCSIDGDAIDPRTYEDVFYRHIKLAGIQTANYHSLRHTFATRAIENNIDIVTLSKILGHAKPSTTANMYCHSTEVSQRKCVEVFNNLNFD